MTKTIEQLRLVQQKIEELITQEKHKQQRLENRIRYYEQVDRRKRGITLSPVGRQLRAFLR